MSECDRTATRAKIEKLIEKIGSKFSVAKKLEVSWNTVHLWSLGMYQASNENIKKINSLLGEKE